MIIPASSGTGGSENCTRAMYNAATTTNHFNAVPTSIPCNARPAGLGTVVNDRNASNALPSTTAPPPIAAAIAARASCNQNASATNAATSSWTQMMRNARRRPVAREFSTPTPVMERGKQPREAPEV